MSTEHRGRRLTVGVSGHRFLADVDRVGNGIDAALARIARVFSDPEVDVCSSLAEGADRLVVERVLARPGARLCVPLPLPRERYVEDFASEESRDDFARLLHRADEVFEVPPQPSREEAYRAAGIEVLARSDVLIAVWDGASAQGPGGTAEIVAEARRRKLPIAWVHAGNRRPGTNEAISLGRRQGKVTFENFRAHPRKPRLVVHVGVTGHREHDLIGCDLDAVRAQVADLLARVRAVVRDVASRNADDFSPQPPLVRLFSRLADGADLLVAEEGLKQGFDLHCPLPFARDAYEQHIAADWRPVFRRVLTRAAAVIELDGDAEAGDLGESFFESRRMVLRHSDVLLAVWDPSHRPSGVWGTTRLVDEARHDDLLVVHIPPRAPAEAHLDVREQDADIHTVALESLESRLASLLAPPEPSAPRASVGDGAERLHHASFLEERPRRWTMGFAWSMFRDLVVAGRLSRPRLRLPDLWRDSGRSWAKGWDAEPPLAEEVCEPIDALLREPFAWADGLAVYYADLTRSSMLLNYLMAAAAVLLALLGYGLGWTEHDHALHDCAWIWVAAEVALILAIVGNTRFANGRRWHQRWIDYRVLAERIRLQRFLAPLGRLTPHTRRPAHLSFGDVRGSWLAWYFRALARELAIVGGRYDEIHAQACRAALTKLLDGEDGQICWHRENARQFHLLDHRLHRGAFALFVATGIAGFAHLFWHSAWLTVACAVFPAFGASLAAIANHAQLDRVAKHSESMAECLMGLSQYLIRQPPLTRSLGPPCEEIAECLTSEVLDWRSLFPGRIRLPS